jgi:protein TonB
MALVRPGTAAASDTQGSAIAVLDPNDGRVLTTVSTTAKILALSFAPGGRELYWRNEATGNVHVVNASTGSEVTVLRRERPDATTAVPNARLSDAPHLMAATSPSLAVFGDVAGVELWDASRSRWLGSIPLEREAHALASSHEGKFLAIGQPGGALLFRAESPSSAREVLNVRFEPATHAFADVLGPLPGQEFRTGSGEFGAGAYRADAPLRQPELISMPPPDYPREAQRARVQGVTKFDAVVLADGTIGDIRLVQSLDTRFGLDDRAAAALKQWRFRPALSAAGKPLPVIVRVELTFRVQ